MQTHISTTPFGRRSVTLGMITGQIVAKSAPQGAKVDKWKVFYSIRDAKELLGATDRSLTLLNALLSFHLEPELSADRDLIVWPSNEALMARANGMPPTTLRRHLAVLVDCGLIVRRDSPNGKRFVRKGRGGEIEQAYGFDLSPIVARAQEFEDQAQAVRAEKKAFHVAKERLTLLRRDIVKLIDAGIEENVPGNWTDILRTYQGIVGRLPRSATRPVLEEVCTDLHGLYAHVRDLLETFAKTLNLDANESRTGCHIQNSKADSHSETTSKEQKEEALTADEELHNVRKLPRRELPLGIVLDACPNLLGLAQGGAIRHWRDFLAAAELVRPMVGVSQSAWQEAKEVMGDQHAAVTLAAIYQRSEQISNAGGYLRSLTDRARERKFSAWPMIMALVRAKLDASNPGNTASGGQSFGVAGRNSNLEVSPALLRTLRKPIS